MALHFREKRVSLEVCRISFLCAAPYRGNIPLKWRMGHASSIGEEHSST